MCDDKRDDLDLKPWTEISRRRFAALATGAGALALAGKAAAAADVVERDVSVRTPDGTSDSAVFYPSGRGSWPGVLFWPDIGGLRPAMRDMARRLAAEGYVVLVVNPFYRTVTAPQYTALNAQVQADAAKRTAARAAMTPEAIDKDAVAFVRYLDAMPQTSNAKVGTQGYCMGGPLAIRTAANNPNRVGAVGSFHGAGLTSDQPASPHLLISKTKARYLICIAKGDDANQPASKTILRETLYKAGLPGTVEVYGGDHGWCVPDSRVYNQAEAERAWSNLLDVYKRSLT